MINLDKNGLLCSVMVKTENDELLKSEMTFPGLRLCFVMHGDAGWRINGVDYRVGSGDVIAFDEAQRRLLTDYGKTELRVFVMQFDRKIFADRRYFNIFTNLIKATNCVIKDQALSSIVGEICNEATNEDKGKYELLSAKMTEFLIKAQRLFQLSDNETEADNEMEDLLDIIDSKLSDGINLAEVARISGLSTSTFSRRFSKHFGISFKKYIMTKKVEKAVNLLKTTDLKVVDVAFECGFNSISGFYDTFKKITGTTPDKVSSVI